ncbi:MAG: hypothetical protein NC084_11295 [Bacteroides sp.]|nr:hypothetical protein [Bacteroides sp.]
MEKEPSSLPKQRCAFRDNLYKNLCGAFIIAQAKEKVKRSDGLALFSKLIPKKIRATEAARTIKNAKLRFVTTQILTLSRKST